MMSLDFKPPLLRTRHLGFFFELCKFWVFCKLSESTFRYKISVSRHHTRTKSYRKVHRNSPEVYPVPEQSPKPTAQKPVLDKTAKLILEHQGITIWTIFQSSAGIPAGLEVSLWCVATVLKRWAICKHTEWFSARLIALTSFVWLGSPTSTHTGSSTNFAMFWFGTAANSAENEQIDVPNVLESS